MSQDHETGLRYKDKHPMIYLAYAAITSADQSVIDTITQQLVFEGILGNPSSKFHQFGRSAEEASESARSHLTEVIGYPLSRNTHGDHKGQITRWNHPIPESC